MRRSYVKLDVQTSNEGGSTNRRAGVEEERRIAFVGLS